MIYSGLHQCNLLATFDIPHQPKNTTIKEKWK